MDSSEQVSTVLNRLSPHTRLIIAAVVPALFVFAAEEARRPSPPVLVDEAPVQYAYSKADLDAVSRLAGGAQKIVGDMDHALATPGATPSEQVCMSGLRNGVGAYMTITLTRLQQDIATAMAMHDEQDEKYIDAIIASASAAPLKAMPSLYATLDTMQSACRSSPVIQTTATQLRSLMTQIGPTLVSTQDRMKPKPK